MAKLQRFSTPGGLDELSAAGKTAWSKTVSGMVDDAVRRRGPGGSQFYNPTKTDTAADAQTRSIFWTAFPRSVRRSSPTPRHAWERADSSRTFQDEYCEWAVERRGNKVFRVSFTCEVPEYWDALAGDDPNRLLALYRELAGPKVKLDDLIDADGTYNWFNKWNNSTNGNPIHLTQASNNLDAAVALASDATVVRVVKGRTITSEQELIRCGGFGEPTRNSDPHIGAQINELARMKADVTVEDPAGLYISDFTPAGWKTPDGTDPKSFWKYTRGPAGKRLRGVYEVPESKKYMVGDVTIDGRPIEFGAQIADFVSIKITGVACRFGKSKVAPATRCV
jgi:hypothetical protein